MGEREHLVGRAALATEAERRLAAGRGLVLLGGPGVGKSALAEAVGRRAEAAGGAVVRVRATVGSSELPLGAFSPWLERTEQFLTPMVNEIRGRLLTYAADRALLLVVDDVDLLDDASSVLVHQMVAAGEVTLLATLRTGRLLPGELVDLADRGELGRLDVPPLDRAALAELTTQTLGVAPSSLEVDRLEVLTGGNPLFARVLLAGARRDHEGHLVLVTDSDALVDLVRAQLSGLEDAARKALLHLAFAEPCGPAELASVADADMLAALEQAGLLVGDLDGQRLVLRLSHPLYGEVLRGATSHLQRRAVLGALARDLRATGARRRADVLKLGRLGADGNVPLPPEMVAAAVSAAYAASDMVLTERLARPEFERNRSFRVGWDWVNAAYLSGDLETARTAAAQLGEVAANAAERLAVALISSQIEFWLAADRDRAVALTDAALAADPVDEPGAVSVSRAELIANRAVFFTSAAVPGPGYEGSAPLMEMGLSPAYVRAAVAMSGALYALGRPIESAAVCDRAMEAFTVIGQAGMALSRRTMLANRAIAYMVMGDVPRSAADTDAVIHDAISEQQLSLGYLVAASRECFRGRPSLAAPLVAKAEGWWARSSAGGLASRWVQAVAAFVASTAGDVARAERALAAFDADHHPSRLLDFLAAIARCRFLLASGHPVEAKRGLLAEIERMMGDENLTGSLFCAEELIRIGHHADVAELTAAVAPRVEGLVLTTICAHADAAARDDAAALAEVADRFEATDYLPYAADAAAQAADAARRAGDQRLAARLLQRAGELRERFDAGLPTVSVLVDIGPVALTRREREIGLLAAQGLATKEIAERLFISPRTADNHLGKVYEKLGVRSRGELAELLAV